MAGRSGFCTVARSDGMREALILRLEQLSYYEHRSMSGGVEQPVCAYRIVDIRGSRFHVMSRIQDAGLDFTNRTNFIAHHLVFMPEELRELPVAPLVFSRWDGWLNKWAEEPRVLAAENWGNLRSLSDLSHVPAQTWAAVSGDAINAFGLLDAVSPVLLNTDGLDEQTVLRLFTESLEMMEARDSTADFKLGLWQHTFTTSLQEQDSPSDFRWRCVTSLSPALKKLAANGQNPVSIKSLRAGKFSLTEAAFARKGREPLTVTCQSAAITAQEGDTVTVNALARGVPPPNRFEWYSCARDGTMEKLIAEGSPDLVLDKVTIGMHRLALLVTNSRGENAVSQMVQVSVEKRIGIARSHMPAAPVRVQKPTIDSPVKEEKKPQVWTADAEEFAKHLDIVQRNKKKRTVLVCLGLAALISVFVMALVIHFLVKKSSDRSRVAASGKQTVEPAITVINFTPGGVTAGSTVNLIFTLSSGQKPESVFIGEWNGTIVQWDDATKMATAEFKQPLLMEGKFPVIVKWPAGQSQVITAATPFAVRPLTLNQGEFKPPASGPTNGPPATQ